MLFKILFAIGVLAALFVVSSGVMTAPYLELSVLPVAVWLTQCGAVIALLAGALWLRARGRPMLANGLLGLLAVPIFLFALFAFTMTAFRP